MNNGEDLRKQWKQCFTKSISKSVKKNIYFDQFLWHIFSYEIIQCLENEEAIEAFNKEHKKDCYVFYQNIDDVLMLNNAKEIKPHDFISEPQAFYSDIYIVNKDFTWTYVLTHEKYCGPYFYKPTKV
ncbi:hypothetical protein BCI9360_00499 [Bacillus sp. CECT 9360]|nr:hypothetical protein BCI9360_00499 [Bacillus sp. CECT 9360]